MEATTLSYDNLHNHGELFANMFRARHRTFIQNAKWDLPEANGMEFDQYDTPASRWIAVHDGGEVLAGVRLTPTTARVGMYTYMIRDAQRGMLESIPSDLMDFEAPVDPKIWEASRIFVSASVPARLAEAARQGCAELVGTTNFPDEPLPTPDQLDADRVDVGRRPERIEMEEDVA